jgi:hypothetical protein
VSGNGETQRSGKDSGDAQLEGMAFEPSVNQVRNEPVPASPEEDKDTEAAAQNEEHWRRSACESGPAGAVPGKSRPG